MRKPQQYIVTDANGMPTAVNDARMIDAAGIALAAGLTAAAGNPKVVAQLVDDTLARVGAVAFPLTLHTTVVTLVDILDKTFNHIEQVFPGFRAGMQEEWQRQAVSLRRGER